MVKEVNQKFTIASLSPVWLTTLTNMALLDLIFNVNHLFQYTCVCSSPNSPKTKFNAARKKFLKKCSKRNEYSGNILTV